MGCVVTILDDIFLLKTLSISSLSIPGPPGWCGLSVDLAPPVAAAQLTRAATAAGRRAGGL